MMESKALIRAHCDAMINWFDPDTLRTQIADGYFDHRFGRAMSADDVIAHAVVLHHTLTDLSITLDDIVADGQRVAVRATWRGTHVRPFRGFPPTGRRITFTGMVFWRVRDGKVAERWAEVDFSPLIGGRESEAA
jgi:steroid delta-isomerase-like uncharacterized protein